MSNRDEANIRGDEENDALEDIDMDEFMRELDRRTHKREQLNKAAWSRVDDLMEARRLDQELCDLGEDKGI